ncbi:hypothetical protein N7E02_09040 [Aliirhizobium terrae]|uniref:hypothetical protein n=1 Tax=Terrirhizobium terrae TaxID=2926709 RepID=UPI002574A5E4|nr:hypothetical protein [Rhizobium sp. CC-CFT758]WJH40725.1 hypothetical protein N7E02_09040 [Rhizobium sp. CC-CFT758]
MTEKDLDHRPPVEVAAAAEKGLKLRAKYRRGGTTLGIARARDLQHRKSLSDLTVKRMASYFSRHKIDKRSENFGNDDDPSTGYIAWLLWGGDAGQKWAEEHLKIIESRKKETRRPSRNALDGNVQRHFNSQH